MLTGALGPRRRLGRAIVPSAAELVEQLKEIAAEGENALTEGVFEAVKASLLSDEASGLRSWSDARNGRAASTAPVQRLTVPLSGKGGSVGVSSIRASAMACASEGFTSFSATTSISRSSMRALLRAGSAQGGREHATGRSMRPALARRSNPASSRAAAPPAAVSLPVSDNLDHATRSASGGWSTRERATVYAFLGGPAYRYHARDAGVRDRPRWVARGPGDPIVCRGAHRVGQQQSEGRRRTPTPLASSEAESDRTGVVGVVRAHEPRAARGPNSIPRDPSRRCSAAKHVARPSRHALVLEGRYACEAPAGGSTLSEDVALAWRW